MLKSARAGLTRLKDYLKDHADVFGFCSFVGFAVGAAICWYTREWQAAFYAPIVSVGTLLQLGLVGAIAEDRRKERGLEHLTTVNGVTVYYKLKIGSSRRGDREEIEKRFGYMAGRAIENIAVYTSNGAMKPPRSAAGLLEPMPVSTVLEQDMGDALDEEEDTPPGKAKAPARARGPRLKNDGPVSEGYEPEDYTKLDRDGADDPSSDEHDWSPGVCVITGKPAMQTRECPVMQADGSVVVKRLSRDTLFFDKNLAEAVRRGENGEEWHDPADFTVETRQDAQGEPSAGLGPAAPIETTVASTG